MELLVSYTQNTILNLQNILGKSDKTFQYNEKHEFKCKFQNKFDYISLKIPCSPEIDDLRIRIHEIDEQNDVGDLKG